MENKNINSEINWLKEESRGWVEQGVISENQRVLILERYPQKTAEEEHREIGEKTAKFILIFAAILIGLGIFSFIAANWQKMGDFLKVAIIVISMLAAYASGWIAKEKGYEKTGLALIFLGTIIYGAGIFLVAQIYNIRANWPDGFILWMLGAFGIAYVFDSALIYIFGMLAGAVAIFGYPFDIFDSFMRFDQFYFTSLILLFIAFAATFVSALLLSSRGGGTTTRDPLNFKS